MRLDDYSPFGSLDWGYNAPGVMLWWLCRADGGLHIYREYKFRETPAEDVAKKIKAMNEEMGIKQLRYIACDPAIWQKTGSGRGESIAETLLRFRLPVRKGDNDRFNGWQRVQQLLRPMPNGQRPWLTVEPTCAYLIRTIPAQVQDKHNPDDLDTNKDDHAVDALRYGAMSRPAPGVEGGKVEMEPPPNSWGWWRKYHARQGRPKGVLA